MSRKDLIMSSARKVAELIGTEPERLARNDRGLVLSPTQLEMLEAALLAKGVEKAAKVLEAEAERVNQPGPDRNLNLWSIYLAGAALLEGESREDQPVLPRQDAIQPHRGHHPHQR